MFFVKCTGYPRYLTFLTHSVPTRRSSYLGGACAAIDLPEHAFLSDTSFAGWQCEVGYVARSGACAKVEVPEHGYLMHKRFGPAWRCYRGYTRVDDRCVAVAVPEHGYLTAAGYDWKCERGFQEVGTHCKQIVLPENADRKSTRLNT